MKFSDPTGFKEKENCGSTRYNFIADLKAAFNFDFGRDYINTATEALNSKDYLSWANLELGATCEIIYDLAAAYGVAVFIGKCISILAGEQ